MSNLCLSAVMILAKMFWTDEYNNVANFDAM